MSGTAESAAVALEFEDFRTFLNAVSANISQEGMFVESAEPRSPGCELDLDLRLEGGEALIHGRGEVVWVAENGDASASGMGVRFLDLNKESERLIGRIVDTRTKAGQKLFDIERGASEVAETAHRLSSNQASAESQEEKGADAGQIERLKVELAAVTRTRDELSERLQEQAADIERWSEQGRHAMVERDKLVSKIQRLEEQLEQQAAESARTSEQGEQESVEREKLRAEKDLLELKVEEQGAELARFAEQGKYAMAERDRLEADKASLTEQLEAARSEAGGFESDKASLTEQLEAAQSEAGRFESEKASLIEQLEAAQSEAGRLESEAEALKEAAGRVEELEVSLAEARTTAERLQGELAEAFVAAETFEQQSRDKQEKLQAQVGELEENRAKLCASLEDGQTELDEVRRQYEESLERNGELETRVGTLDTELGEAHEFIQGLEAEAEKAGAKMTDLRRTYDEMQSELAIQKTVAVREKKLSERVRAEHLSLQEDYAEVQAALEELTEQVRNAEFERELASGDLLAAPVLDDETAPETPAGETSEGDQTAEIDSLSLDSEDKAAGEASVESPEGMAAEESPGEGWESDPVAEMPEGPVEFDTELPESEQQSGLWATLVRTLGGGEAENPVVAQAAESSKAVGDGSEP